LLADRPCVGGDPVEDQPGREADDEDHEEQREQQHEPPLGLIRRRRLHHQARSQLRPDVEHDQHHQCQADSGVGQVVDEQPARSVQPVTRGRVSDGLLERDVVMQRIGVPVRRLEARTDVLAQPCA
jgi:hypothetical protein